MPELAITTSKLKLQNNLFDDLTAVVEYCHGGQSGIETGLPQIDEQMRGLKGFVGILGEPKTCKSSFLLSLAIHNAKKGIPVIYIDRENGKIQTAIRAICAAIGEGVESLSQMSSSAIREVGESLSSLPLLYLFDLDEEELESCLDRIGEGILIVDSLHALPFPSGIDSMRAAVDYWLNYFDSLKLKYGGKITIICSIEKNRSSYGTSSLKAAKESGRIEYKLEQLLSFIPQGDEIVIECILNRHGPKGQIMSIRKNYSRSGEFTFSFK